MLKFYFIFITSCFFSMSASAVRVNEEMFIRVGNEERRYFHLYDKKDQATPIVLISGSGCDDFSQRFASFFDEYSAPLNVYFLVKQGVEKDSDGRHCSLAYKKADSLEQRVADTLSFIKSEPTLSNLPEKSIALLGFSEGGVVAPLVALNSKKIGWLASAGSGGIPQSDAFLIFADRGVSPYAKPFSKKILLNEFAEIKKNPHSIDKEFFGKTYLFWSSHLFYNPIDTYLKLDIPVLVAMGEYDESEPVESGRYLKEVFAKNKQFQFIEYAKASHSLRTPDKNFALSFVAGLAAWIKGEPFPSMN